MIPEMAEEIPPARKSVLLTSDCRPNPHPLATVFHDANNKLFPITAALDIDASGNKSSIPEDVRGALMSYVMQVRDEVGELLRTARKGMVDATQLREDLTYLRRRLRVVLPLIPIECPHHPAIAQAVDEFNMLMERGIEFINETPPEDRPSFANLTEHVSELVQDYRGRYPGIQFHFDVIEEHKTLFHPPSLKRGLENLLNNAVQALPQNGGEIRIELEDRSYSAENVPFSEIEGGDYVAIIITDNGSGIEEEVLVNLRDSMVTTKDEGSGLGLVSARKSMIRHRGHLILESEKGEGAKATALIRSSYPPPASLPRVRRKVG